MSLTKRSSKPIELRPAIMGEPVPRATIGPQIGPPTGWPSLIGRCAGEVLTRKPSYCTYSAILMLGCEPGSGRMRSSFLRQQENQFLSNSRPNPALLALEQE